MKLTKKKFKNCPIFMGATNFSGRLRIQELQFVKLFIESETFVCKLRRQKHLDLSVK